MSSNIIDFSRQYQDHDNLADFLAHLKQKYPNKSAPEGKYVWYGATECFDHSCGAQLDQVREFVLWKKQNPQTDVVCIGTEKTGDWMLQMLFDVGYCRPLYFRSALIKMDINALLYHNDANRADVWKDRYEVKFMFTSLLRRQSRERCILIDNLCNQGILDNTFFTWSGPDPYEPSGENGHYEFKYWTPTKILSDDHFDVQKNLDAAVQDRPEPLNYHHSFFDLVCESNMFSPMLTEKTVRPMWYGKPFAILGCANYNKHMQEYWGFKLYDEIFDYSYDSIIDDDERTYAYIDSVCKAHTAFSNADFVQLQDELFDKIKFNRMRLSYILENKIGEPEEIKELLIPEVSDMGAYNEFQNYKILEG